MIPDTPILKRIQKARTALLLDHPFFGSLLFRLKGHETRSVKTMATDGISLYYNPDFVDTLNAATLAGTLAHEVMHPALRHHTRRAGRDPKRWNEACDYAINPLLLDAGLRLPEGVLVDNRFRGLSAEEIYNRLAPESNACGSQIRSPHSVQAHRLAVTIEKRRAHARLDLSKGSGDCGLAHMKLLRG